MQDMHFLTLSIGVPVPPYSYSTNYRRFDALSWRSAQSRRGWD